MTATAAMGNTFVLRGLLAVIVDLLVKIDGNEKAVAY